MFARARVAGRLRFRRFVKAGKKAASPLEAVENQIYFGDEGFVDGMREKAADWGEVSEIPVVQRRPKTVPLAKIRAIVALEWGTTSQALSNRRGGEEKIAAMYLARKLSGLPVWQIAREFGVKPARVSNAMTELDQSPLRRALRVRLLKLGQRLREQYASV